MNKRLLLIVFLFLALGFSSFGQNKVTVSPNVQRFVNGVSNLERQKFFNIHMSWSERDITAQEYNHLTNTLNVGMGRGFWGPYSVAKQETKEVNKYPSNLDQIKAKGAGLINYAKSQSTWSRRSRWHIATEHPKNVLRWNTDVNAAALWAVRYFEHYYTDDSRPMFYEPMNEPFVHAGETPFSDLQPNADKMRRKMAEMFRAIGKKFDETPAVSNVKVIGYSSAWPSVELSNFGHWNDRMKMFMDVAGPYMDGFATHLYDGVNVTGADSQRSGSNSEAILDLIEVYSNYKWNKVKPHAITEYGGIERGYPDVYSDAKHSQSMKSINHILFNLLDRQADILTSIPFIGTKRVDWLKNPTNNYQPYGSVLWRPKKVGQPIDNNTEWVYTPRVNFYKMWQSVKGKRIHIKSENPDIQTQAFLSGSKLYVALSNLNGKNTTANLSFTSGLSDLKNIRIKRLKIWKNSAPEYTDKTTTVAPSSLTLVEHETVVLEYTFNSPIVFNNAIRTKKYYSKTHLKAINGSQLSFPINGVATGSKNGFAYLRMSIGRKHNRSKKPIVKVNGQVVVVPSNWAGGDQATRKDFFGTIVIPVPVSYLAVNNTITVKFPDSGGHISSMILQVELFDKSGGGSSQLIKDGEYEIRSVANGNNLGAIRSEGWAAVDVTPGAYSNQRWIVKHLSNDVYTFKLKDVSAGIKYLEVPYAACAKNTLVGTYLQATGAHQQWKVVSVGSHYQLVPNHCQTQALDVRPSDNKVHTWDINATNRNQKWIFINTKKSGLITDLNSPEEQSFKASVYPNPASDVLNIEMSNSGNAKSIKVFGTNGQLFHQTKTMDDCLKLDVKNTLPRGMYFLHVIDGNVSEIHKIFIR